MLRRLDSVSTTKLGLALLAVLILSFVYKYRVETALGDIGKWQIYTSSTHGFSIKYPRNFFISDTYAYEAEPDKFPGIRFIDRNNSYRSVSITEEDPFNPNTIRRYPGDRVTAQTVAQLVRERMISAYAMEDQSCPQTVTEIDLVSIQGANGYGYSSYGCALNLPSSSEVYDKPSTTTIRFFETEDGRIFNVIVRYSTEVSEKIADSLRIFERATPRGLRTPQPAYFYDINGNSSSTPTYWITGTYSYKDRMRMPGPVSDYVDNFEFEIGNIEPNIPPGFVIKQTASVQFGESIIGEDLYESVGKGEICEVRGTATVEAIYLADDSSGTALIKIYSVVSATKPEVLLCK